MLHGLPRGLYEVLSSEVLQFVLTCVSFLSLSLSLSLSLLGYCSLKLTYKLIIFKSGQIGHFPSVR